jgi:hypothetical protein
MSVLTFQNKPTTANLKNMDTHLLDYMASLRAQDSIVGIATHYGLDSFGV